MVDTRITSSAKSEERPGAAVDHGRAGDTAFDVMEAREFCDVLNVAPVLLWVSDQQQLCIWCNSSWLSFTGRSLDQVRGNAWITSVHPDDLKRLQDAYLELRGARQPSRLEFRLRRSDGHYRWVLGQIASRFSEDGKRLGAVGTCLDITDQKNAEEQLAERTRQLSAANISERRRAERWFQHLLESAPDALAIVGTNGELLLVNRQTESVFGYTREELVGQPMEILVPERFRDIHPQYRRKFFAQRRSRPMNSHLELSGLRKDGTEFPVEISLSPIEGPQGVVVACAIRDITERKRAEHLLQQRQEELAHVARLATAGEMATGLAHELNQPLYSIANYARGCINRLDSSTIDPGQFREVAEDIAAEAERAAEIIRRLRRMVQKREPVRSVIDVNQAVDEACALYRADLGRHGVCLDRKLDTSLPEVVADDIQLQQVTLNLMRNAVEAMRETPEDDRILRILTCREDERSVRVAVVDAGCGIAEDQLGCVFDAFHTTNPTGMGMGLAISRFIIESCGGRIWATNNPARGVTFHFVLPIATDEADER